MATTTIHIRFPGVDQQETNTVEGVPNKGDLLYYIRADTANRYWEVKHVIRAWGGATPEVLVIPAADPYEEGLWT